MVACPCSVWAAFGLEEPTLWPLVDKQAEIVGLPAVVFLGSLLVSDTLFLLVDFFGVKFEFSTRILKRGKIERVLFYFGEEPIL